MAIEFDCPSCDSTIRVPDAAAGKKGKCPRCEAIIRVPEIELPEAANAAPEPPPSANHDAAAPERPDWMRGRSREDAGSAEEPGGFVEAPPDGPPDFSALAESDAPGEDPLIRTEPPPAAPPPEPQPTAPVNEFGLPVIETGRRKKKPATESAAAPVRGSRRRGRRSRKDKGRRNSKPWLVPVLGVVVLATLFGGYRLFVSPPYWVRDLVGTPPPEITAEAYTFLRLEPKSLDAATAGVNSDRFAEVAATLASQQVLISSSLMSVELRGSKGTIDVRVAVGSRTMFVKVEKASMPELQEFLKRNRRELDDAQLAELREAADDFARVVAAKGIHFSGEQLARFRNELALNALNGVLGSHLEAVHGEDVFPCVYEDAEAVYFLLPEGAEAFQLRGREFGEHGRLVPLRYLVTIAAVHEVEPPESDDPWRRGGDPEAEAEPEPPGLGESMEPPESTPSPMPEEQP